MKVVICPQPQGSFPSRTSLSVIDTTLQSRSSSFGTCLDRHSITRKVRSRMVQWLFEVICVYHQSLETFFLTVRLLDSFLSHTSTKYYEDSILLLLTCLFIASKLEEVKPLLLNTVAAELGKGKVGEKAIMQCELMILATLHYEVCISTPLSALRDLALTHSLPSSDIKTAEAVLVASQSDVRLSFLNPAISALLALSISLATPQKSLP